jgi:hypothetical protein
MKQRLLLAFIFLGSLYISYSIGHELGFSKSHAATMDAATKVCSLTIAYAAAQSLEAEMGNHTFIKSGNTDVAKQFALKRIDITINQVEGIDYRGTPFEAEINQNLLKAKEYVKNARNPAK